MTSDTTTPTPNGHRRRVLVTGAAGDIGRGFVRRYANDYDFVLLDLPGAMGAVDMPPVRVVEADVRDLAALKAAFVDVDTVLHLAAYRKPSTTWDRLLHTNIVGTYNVVAAAIAARCRRVVYASSVHAVSGYPLERQLREDDPVNPGDLYGVSKCFGEALGRYAAEQEGLSFVALRIGAVQPADALTNVEAAWGIDEYCAPDDLFDLMKRCIDTQDLRFEIFNAASGNRFNRLDITKARARLGYAPRHDAFALVPAVRDALDSVAEHRATTPSGMRDDITGGYPMDGVAAALAVDLEGS